MELISIIVPVYNCEQYLDRCISSIVNQTYKNLEIILVDDGSTDSSSQKCDEWAKKDKRVKAIHKENGGVSSARNVGIDNVKGKYIGFVDSDDYINNNMYELMVKSIKDNDSQMSCCNINLISNNKKEFYYNYKKTIDKKEFLDKITKEPNITLWNKLFIKEIANNNKFKEEIKMSEDAVYLYEYIDKISKISYVDKALYNYRTDNNSSLTKEKNIKIISTSIYSLNNVIKILEKYKIKERFNKQLEMIGKYAKYYKYNNFEYSEFIKNNYKKIVMPYLKLSLLFKVKGIKNKIKLLYLICFFIKNNN